MKVKFLKELPEEDLQRFRQSELYRISHAGYRQCEIHLDYYREYFGPSWEDVSLIAYDDKCFAIVVYMFLGNGELSFFGAPLEVFSDPAVPVKDINYAFQELFVRIDRLKEERGAKLLRFFEHPAFLLKYYEMEGFRSHVEYETAIELTRSEEDIFMCVRKSYKSLINWGRKNLEIKVYDQSNMEDSVMEDFENFHIEVAHRRTRSHESWMLQSKAIKEGMGFVVLGYLEGKLVTATLILNGLTECYYGVCVNNRDLMAQKLPIGHYGLYLSILLAKEKGLKVFRFGDVTDHPDPKVNAIVKYKRGFNNELYTRVACEIDL